MTPHPPVSKTKPLEMRLQEAMNIRMQIRNLGMEAFHGEELHPLYRIMNDFVREGISASGKIVLSSCEFSKLEYRFSNTSVVDSYCRVVK